MWWLIGYLIGFVVFTIIGFVCTKIEFDKWEEIFPGPYNPARISLPGILLVGIFWPIVVILTPVSIIMDARKEKEDKK